MNEVIKINNLSFIYPDGQPALSGLSLTVGQGESVAVIGPNGAGKSTLLLHLNGILHSNGTVKVFDRPVNDKNLRWVRSRVGLVFQDPDDQLFSPTVFDDVAFGPINMGYSEAEVHRAVSKALEWVGMTGYEKRSSHHLSIGERKRIAIATVLSMSPQILALDEPSGNLDPRSKWSLISLLRRLPMTKIVATHDLELVRALCSRTVILDRGQIVIDDATSLILNDKSLLAAHGLAPPPAS
ncbi:MAG: ATP-binding cassette domain-containing protein [Dehalococcoidia bacterium]|nr:MAG: ATP-binding cassette domain-containing protein [Dehalococcoidia bacterium]